MTKTQMKKRVSLLQARLRKISASAAVSYKIMKATNPNSTLYNKHFDRTTGFIDEGKSMAREIGELTFRIENPEVG